MCPGCESWFESPPTSQRLHVYCPDCKANKVKTDRRFCPICTREFELEGRPSGTVFCSDTCKEERQEAMKRQCQRWDCTRTRPYFTEQRLQPQFCSEDCTRAWIDEQPVHRKICANPDCNNSIPVNLARLRRLPKYCSRECRESLQPDRQNLKTTRALKRKIDATHVFNSDMYVIYKTGAKRKERQPWNSLGKKIQAKLMKDGWTETSWHTSDGFHSPAVYAGELKPVEIRGVQDDDDTPHRPGLEDLD